VREESVRRTLSATDLVTLYGCSPYAGASEHQVFADHVYPEPHDGKGESPLWKRLGNHVEPFSLQILAEEMGCTLRKIRTCVSEKHPWLLARPDAIALPGKKDPVKALRARPLEPSRLKRAKAYAVCEAKFISDPRMAQLWIDARPRPPLYVHVQAQAEMTALGLQRAIGIGIVMGNPYIWELDHDGELEEEMLAIGENFLKSHIDTLTPPAWDGSKAADRLLMRKYPSPEATFWRADLTSTPIAIEYNDLDDKITALKKQRDICEQQLKEIIGDRSGIVGDAFKCTWKAPRTGKIAWKSVAHVLAPDGHVPRKVIDENTGEPTRRFCFYNKNKLSEMPAGLDIDEALEGAAAEG